MHSRPTSNDQSDAMKYVRSLGDAVKRRFANDYLRWIRAGRVDAAPGRGALGAAAAKAVTANLDGLA